jgi:hypothetical protein
MLEVSKMEAGKAEDQKAKTFIEARKLLDDAWARANKVYKEAKEQADIVHNEAKKLAVDKEVKKRADEAHKEAIKEAGKVRDAITSEAQVVFTTFWAEKDKDTQETIIRSKESSDLAQKGYKEAKKQADIAHKAAKGQAIGKEGKKAADQVRKETLKQAKKDYNEAINN